MLTHNWEWGLGLGGRWDLAQHQSPPFPPKRVKVQMVTASAAVPPTRRGPSLTSPHPARLPSALESLALPSSEAPVWPVLPSPPNLNPTQWEKTAGISMAELDEKLVTKGLDELAEDQGESGQPGS